MKLKLSRPQWVTFFLLLLLGSSPFIAEWSSVSYFIPILTRITIFGLAAVSLNFILGYGGMVSFAHAAFMGLGAYTVAILSQHSFDEAPFLTLNAGEWMNNALIIWPLAMLVAAFFSLIIGFISLRTKGIYFIMITLAFTQMFYFFFVSLTQYGSEDGISMWWGGNDLAMLDLGDDKTLFYVSFCLLCFCLFLFWRFVHSRFGRVLRGFKQNEKRMRAIGFKPLPYQLTAFTIAGAVAGLAGALLANLTEFVSPNLMQWTSSGELLIMVILGGMGSLIGPILGAATLLLLEEWLISITEHWQLFLGPLLIFIVLFAKAGISSLLLGQDHD